MSDHQSVARFKNSEGGLSQVTLSPRAVEKYGETAVIAAAVPAGVDYQIVQLGQAQADYEQHGIFRDAWEYDATVAPSGQGSASNLPSGGK